MGPSIRLAYSVKCSPTWKIYLVIYDTDELQPWIIEIKNGIHREFHLTFGDLDIISQGQFFDKPTPHHFIDRVFVYDKGSITSYILIMDKKLGYNACIQFPQECFIGLAQAAFNIRLHLFNPLNC